MNVLIVMGHPRKDSFSEALAEAYRDGAIGANMKVRQIDVAEMQFNPNVFTQSPRDQDLAGIPDYEADKTALKNSIPVIVGRKGPVKIAIFFTIISALVAVSWNFLDIVSGAFGHTVYLILPHAAILIFLLNKYIKDPAPPSHINMLLFTSLTYIIWFGIIPLLKLF